MVNPSEGLGKLLRAKMREKRRFLYEQEESFGSESETAATEMKWPELVVVVIRLLRR